MFLCYHHNNGGSGGSSDCNMKKALTILLVLAVIAVMPLAAADRRGTSEEGAFGIGLNLGTNNGVGLKFGMGDFDIIANVGLNILRLNTGLSLGGDVGFQYEVYDIQFFLCLRGCCEYVGCIRYRQRRPGNCAGNAAALPV